MASALYEFIEQVSREKGIDPKIIVSAVEDAIVVATRKHYKSNENLKAELNTESGTITAFAVKSVVENEDEIEDPQTQISLEEAQTIDPAAELGGEIRIYKQTDVLGRIAAQVAKQVIFQKVREAERDTIFNEYSGRVNEIINATVKRIEGPDYIVDIGKTEGRLPKKEQSRLESFSVGERIRVALLRVDKASKGPAVIVSRAAPELVTSLFQSEVPEIYDGTVVIRAVAREAGERTKIAVLSKDKDVDCVGACVGMKGMRVQSIIRELHGEKIDIIEYHDDPVVFAEKALQPAKVARVSMVEGAEKHLEVVVDDTQLSLAIGKKGQNVRLAAKLLGWKIDIKSEEEKRQEVEQAMDQLVASANTPLEKVEGLGEGLVEKLKEAGITTVEALADMTPEQLEEIPGVGPKTIEKISLAVSEYFTSLETANAAAAAEAETAVEPVVEATAEVTPDAIAEATPDATAEVAVEAEAAAVEEEPVSAKAKLEETVADAETEAAPVKDVAEEIS